MGEIFLGVVQARAQVTLFQNIKSVFTVCLDQFFLLNSNLVGARPETLSILRHCQLKLQIYSNYYLHRY